MKNKFDVELKAGRLRIDIDLDAYGLAAVDSVEIGPDPCLSESGRPDERFIIDICGTKQPSTEDPRETEGKSDDREL